MTGQAYFGPELFAFLRELKANNDRAWFQSNRRRYEQDVRDPLLRFVADFGPRLEATSACFVADPRPVGGSMFRIYRDTRFSKDKSPYKTAAAAHFRHEAGSRDVHAPGFYLHLEPGMCFGGAGIWHPDADTQATIRRAIVEHPERWEAVREQVGPLHGDVSKRAPRGFPPDHPLIDDLKRKDFTTAIPFSDAQVCAPDFLDRYAEQCRAVSPLVEFLARTLGLAW